MAFCGVSAGIPDTFTYHADWNTSPGISARELKSFGLFKDRKSVSSRDEDRRTSKILRDQRRMTELVRAAARVSQDETPPMDDVLYEIERPGLSYPVVDELRRLSMEYDAARNIKPRAPVVDLSAVDEIVSPVHPDRRCLRTATFFDAAFMDDYLHNDNIDYSTDSFFVGNNLVKKGKFCYADCCTKMRHALVFESNVGVVNVRLGPLILGNSHLISDPAKSYAAKSIVKSLLHACGASLHTGVYSKMILNKRFQCVICLTDRESLPPLIRYLTIKGVCPLHIDNIHSWPHNCSDGIFVTTDPSYLGCADLRVIVDHGNYTISDGVHGSVVLREPSYRGRICLERKTSFDKWLASSVIVDQLDDILSMFHVVHYDGKFSDYWRKYPPNGNPDTCVR